MNHISYLFRSYRIMLSLSNGRFLTIVYVKIRNMSFAVPRDGIELCITQQIAYVYYKYL